MSNKLVMLKKIQSIQPIENADKIEVAILEGLAWKVVIEKGRYNIGDSVVYVTPDTFVPMDIAPFLVKDKPKEYMGILGERLKPKRIKNVVSNGLILPIEIVQNKAKEKGIEFNSLDDEKYAEILGIVKYEKEISIKMGEFYEEKPSFFPKTDEINIESCPEKLSEFIGEQIYITEKIDGTSATFYEYNGEIGVCSRTKKIKEGENIYWDIYKRYKIMDILKGKNMAIQGEIYGEKIQKNPLKIKGIDFMVFDVWLIDEGRYMGYDELINFCKDNNLPMVKVLYEGEYGGWEISGVKNMAIGKYDSGVDREGIVIRSKGQKRISFKVMNDEYKE